MKKPPVVVQPVEARLETSERQARRFRRHCTRINVACIVFSLYAVVYPAIWAAGYTPWVFELLEPFGLLLTQLPLFYFVWLLYHLVRNHRVPKPLDIVVCVLSCMLFIIYPSSLARAEQVSQVLGTKLYLRRTVGVNRLNRWAKEEFKRPLSNIIETEAPGGAALPKPPDYWLDRTKLPWYIRNLAYQPDDFSYEFFEDHKAKIINIAICQQIGHTYGLLVASPADTSAINKWGNSHAYPIITRLYPGIYCWQFGYNTIYL